MAERTNAFGQPIGPIVENWQERPFPAPLPIDGRYCRLEKLDAERHAADLFTALSESPDARDWTYLFAEPFSGLNEYAAYLAREQEKLDPQHYAIIDAQDGKAAGTAALMRIEPTHGVIEVGHITYAPRLKRSRRCKRRSLVSPLSSNNSRAPTTRRCTTSTKSRRRRAASRTSPDLAIRSRRPWKRRSQRAPRHCRRARQTQCPWRARTTSTLRKTISL